MRTLRDAAVGINRTTKGDTDALNDRVVNKPANHDRFDQAANGVNGHRSVRSMANRVCAVDDSSVAIRERDTMTSPANFDGDR